MMRSLYSAISGLKNHQTKMDVIGNNIANVNTTGFKRSRVTFATTLSQTLKGASSPTANLGGANSIQVGMGAMLGSIDQIMTKGSSQSTGKSTDMLLEGSGFFVLNNNGQQVYTRAGGFGRDSEGTLEDPATGSKVQGYSWGTEDDSLAPVWSAMGDIKFAVEDKLASDAGMPVDTISYTLDAGNTTDFTSEVVPIPAYYTVPAGSENVTISGMTEVSLTTTPSSGQFNYDPKTGIVAFSTGFLPPAAGSGLNIDYVVPAPLSAANTATIAIVDYPPKPGATVYIDSIPYTLAASGTPKDGEYIIKSVNGKYQITFGANDVGIPDYTDNIGTPHTGATGTAATSVTAATKITYDFTNKAHILTDYSIDQSGVITGVYSNGVDSVTHKIAQIAVASFANDAGLVNTGGSFYNISNNSGTASIGAAGEEGRATLVSSSIEMSNVDLATEFTDMIVAQRGFQANSRVITVSDTLLEELINLKR